MNFILVLAVFLCVVVMMGVLVYSNMSRESFQPSMDDQVDIQPDFQLRQMVKNINRRNEVETSGQYVPKTAIEQSARTVARDYCPVPPNFDVTQYIKKTDVEQTKCPPMPDMKDYVLKSSIPPAQQCPACICPKVKVSGDLQKKCPECKLKCPEPKPCDYDVCKDIVKCGPKEQEIPPCPKCPAPKPCPTEPPKMCPAVRLPTPDDLKCPPPQPCPKEKCPPCKYMGLKEVDRDLNKVIDDMMEDNKYAELLELRERLNNMNIDDPEELKKKLEELRQKMANDHQHETDPLLQSKLDTMLQDIQSLKNRPPQVITPTKVQQEKIQEEEMELNPTTTVRPSNYNDKCNSLPLTMNKFDVVGASLV